MKNDNIRFVAETAKAEHPVNDKNESYEKEKVPVYYCFLEYKKTQKFGSALCFRVRKQKLV